MNKYRVESAREWFVLVIRVHTHSLTLCSCSRHYGFSFGYHKTKNAPGLKELPRLVRHPAEPVAPQGEPRARALKVRKVAALCVGKDLLTTWAIELKGCVCSQA
jgi:hypothetical protein